MSLLFRLSTLDPLSDEEKNNLSLFCQEKFLNKWDILFNEWDDASAMYILETWKMEIRKNIWGKNTLLWEIKPEEVLWEMALFWEQWTRMATAKALEDSVLLVILTFSIKKLTFKHPELLEKIQKIIKDREIINKKIEREIR